MDETKLYRQRTAGVKAQTVLDNEELQEAFKVLNFSYHMAWQEGVDVAARERAWHMQNALLTFKQHLEQVVQNGHVAQVDIDRISGRVSTIN